MDQELRLLEELRALDLPLCDVGLCLYPDLQNGGYWCTPTNSKAFAGTGGDGHHFSLVEIDGKVSERSPVVMSMPDYSGDELTANVIVGATFRDFLRFGLVRGYFSMGLLAGSSPSILRAFSSPDWQPANEFESFLGLHLTDELQARTLAELSKRLALEPIQYTTDEFQALQNRYAPLLRFSSTDS